MSRSLFLSVLFCIPGVLAQGQSEVASAIVQPRVSRSAAVASAPDALSRRPQQPGGSSGVGAVTSAKAADEGTHDVEIWLGEGVGRFGDYEFSVLGGKPAHPTPTGAFKIEWKSRKWWSKQYNAPMPYSCFFHKGAAIHEGSLRTMSHGCVHVGPAAAKQIYSKGKEKVTRVIVYP